MSDIAIIIPAYNSSLYISKCLDSINTQSYKNVINLYIIDDCSTDQTVDIIKNYSFNSNIILHFQQNEVNMGQGYCRNKLISLIKEKYILFLDSDDYLDEHCLSSLLSYIKNYYDMIVCDWIYYIEENNTFSYQQNSVLVSKERLVGTECADLLSLNVYFSTPALYSTNFLQTNYIKYGEGYWYEDFEFIVQCAMKANLIGFYHYPLYIVRAHKNSTTKINYSGDIHLKSIESAVESSLKFLHNRSEYAIYYFYCYALYRTLLYTRTRAPLRYRYKTIKRIVELLNINQDYSIKTDNSTLFNYIFNKGNLKNNNVLKIIYKDIRIQFGKKRREIKRLLFRKITSNTIDTNKIVMVGFDFERKGNSKYLYDILKNNNYNITYIDEFEKYSYKYYKELNSAKLIILESWNPLKFPKKKDQIFLQLWHGSPIKKMAFDTLEKNVLRINRHSKVKRFKDYSQWDYLLLDTLEDDIYFNKCFIYNNFKTLPYGYPRIKWLLDNEKNQELIDKLKIKYNINKPLILYTPTWRDIQLIKPDDNSFLLDIEKLSNIFPNYQFLIVNHSYLQENNFDYDIQELLLISDVVISDYSSIIFDATRINKKILLFQNDIQDYQNYRGIYNERLFVYEKNICYNINEIIEKLKSIDTISLVNNKEIIDYDNMENNFMNFLNELEIRNDK